MTLFTHDVNISMAFPVRYGFAVGRISDEFLRVCNPAVLASDTALSKVSRQVFGEDSMTW